MPAKSPESVLRRITVVLGASGANRVLLNTVQPLLEKAEVTSLQGVFIEDDELQRTATLPFTKELCRLTLSVHEIHAAQFERALTLRSRTARRAFSSLALRAGVSHSFRTVKGSTIGLLRETVQSADITIFEPFRMFATPITAFSLAPRQSLQRIVVIIDDLARGAETLLAASFLARGKMQGVTILLAGSNSAELDALGRMVDELLPASPGRIVHLPDANLHELIATVHSQRADMLVLGASEDLLKPESLQPLLRQLRCPVCLVRRWSEEKPT